MCIKKNSSFKVILIIVFFILYCSKTFAATIKSKIIFNQINSENIKCGYIDYDDYEDCVSTQWINDPKIRESEIKILWGKPNNEFEVKTLYKDSSFKKTENIILKKNCNNNLLNIVISSYNYGYIYFNHEKERVFKKIKIKNDNSISSAVSLIENCKNVKEDNLLMISKLDVGSTMKEDIDYNKHEVILLNSINKIISNRLITFKKNQHIKTKYIYTLNVVKSNRSKKNFLLASTPDGLEIFEITKSLKLIKLKTLYIKNFKCYKFNKFFKCTRFQSITKGDTYIRHINFADVNRDGIEDIILSGYLFPLSWIDGNIEKYILSKNNYIKLNIIDKYKVITGIDLKKDKNNYIEYIITASHNESKLILYKRIIHLPITQWIKKNLLNTSAWSVAILNVDNKDKIKFMTSNFKFGYVTLNEVF